MTERIRNGQAYTYAFLLVDAGDDETSETGLTPTVQLSKNGGAFANASGAITEISNGWYKVTLSTSETNTDGPLVIRAFGTGTDEWREKLQVYTNSLTDTEVNRIADIILRRNLANVFASANGDALSLKSLYGFMLSFLKASVSGSTKTVQNTDNSTLGTQSLTTSGSAQPVVGISTS